MKLPRDLSGRELIQVLLRHYGYRKVHQVGSHVILQTEDPVAHRIPIPDHAALRLGTLNAILNAVARAKGVTKAEILQRL
jgi:predicted RNA binding protein YcfA (HicA-like mRNA interferase family)